MGRWRSGHPRENEHRVPAGIPSQRSLRPTPARAKRPLSGASAQSSSRLNVEVIHFTVGATDPLPSLLAHGARSVPLAEGSGQTRLSCLHLAAGSQLSEPLATYDCALLLVHP
jgi:hypothetical protein